MPQTRSADGTRLFYVVDGDGPGAPLVLVHGLFCSYRLYDRVVSRVTGRAVVRPDVRGHGRSDRPTDPSQYRWHTFGDDVVAVLDHLGIERAVIGGISLGANVALSVAEHHLDRCAGLIIEMPVLTDGRVAAEHLFPKVLRAGLKVQPFLDRPTALIRRLPDLPWPSELGLLKDILGIEIAAMAALEHGLLDSDEPFPAHDGDTLGRVRVPTLVIGHHRDGLHAISDARVTAERIAGAELVETHSIADLRIQQTRYARILNSWMERNGL